MDAHPTAHPPRRLTGLRVGADPEAWRRADFHVARRIVSVDGVTLLLADPAEGTGVRGIALHPSVDGPIDGLATFPGPAESASPADHPNGVTALDHLVVVTPDLERTTAALAAIGVHPRRSVAGLRGDAETTFRFFLLGTCVLELIGPTPGASRAASSGPAEVVGLAFTTARIDDLGDLAPPPRPAVQPGRRITTLDHHDLGLGVPVALLSPRPPRT